MELFYVVSVVLIIVGIFFTSRQSVNLTAFVAASLGGLLVSLLVFPIWFSAEKSNKESFHEFWNGVELAVSADAVTCLRDGSCVNTYSCDPYTVLETEYYTDSDGNRQSRTVTVTKYHDCPYSSQETTYAVDTTLGQFSILKSAMTGEPFRPYKSIPGGQVTSPPISWVAAKARIDAGVPGGVSKQNVYKNFILGSDTTIFQKFAGDVEIFSEQGLMPVRDVSVFDSYLVDKVHFVGVEERLVPVSLRETLQEDLRRLNGKAGEELTADVNIVIVDASVVDNPDLYADALHAYWLSPEFGRDRLAKNTLNVVIGVEAFQPLVIASEEALEPPVTPSEDVKLEEGVLVTVEPPEPSVESLLTPGEPVVSWARAFTGMPVGNEGLIQEFRTALTGVPVNSDFIGSPVYDVAGESYADSDQLGAVEEVIFGANQFERVSMTAGDSEDVGSGFLYLSSGYELSEGGMVGVHLVAGFILIAGLLGGLALAYRFEEESDFLMEAGKAVGKKLQRK